MLTGYLVQVHPTTTQGDITSIAEQDFIYPLFAILKSAYEADAELQAKAIEELTYIFSHDPESIVCYGDAFLLGGNNRRVKEFLKQLSS